MQKKTEVKENYQFNFSWISYIPIMLILGIVPLIVRLTIVPLDAELVEIFAKTQGSDFFAQYKAGAIYVLTAVILVYLFLTYDKKNNKTGTYYRNYYIAGLVFLVMTLLSTVTSDYRNVALWGIFDRAEGAIMIGCYIIICFYTLYTYKKESDYKYIVWPLCFLIAGATIIGYFQYIGYDLFVKTEWGKQLIIPEKYAEFANNLTGIQEEGHIYGTMYHYNYMGSFGAMMVPLFATLTLFIKNKWEKAIYAMMTLCSLFLLFGSGSRAGVMGLVGSIIASLVIFTIYLAKNWKFIVPIIILVGVVLFGFNSISNGAIFARIPSLVNDAIELFLPLDDSFDYKDELPIRNIISEDGNMIIEMQMDKLVLSVEDGTLVFKDSTGNLVEYIQDGTAYVTRDPRFSEIILQKQAESNEEISYYGIVIKGRIAFYFRVTDSVHLVDSVTMEDIEIANPKTFGFKGKEKLGSARGYIWSRSIPMLKETLLLGNGPDTYVLEFPQKDLLGKLYAYDTTSMIVDKPHNLYLQIALNEGVIALIAFLVIVGTYVVYSFKLYGFKKAYEQRHIIGIAFTLSVVGYLVAGIFNDSIVSVAPIFWVLLGAGIAMNYLVGKEDKLAQGKVEHATINMKTKNIWHKSIDYKEKNKI